MIGLPGAFRRVHGYIPAAWPELIAPVAIFKVYRATGMMTGSLGDSREVIRENMAAAFAGPLKGSSTINKQLSIRFLGDDAAIVVTESGILFAGQAEVPDEGKVNATWVFEKRGGQWLIAAYHNSPVLAG